MSGRGFPCWECGRPAEGGVCLGPHAGYDHSAAVSGQMVMNLDGVTTARRSPGNRGECVEWRRRYWHEVEKPRRAQRRFEERMAAAQRTRDAIAEAERVLVGSSSARAEVEHVVRSSVAPSPLGGGEPRPSTEYRVPSTESGLSRAADRQRTAVGVR